jgi:hypothetical protein
MNEIIDKSLIDDIHTYFTFLFEKGYVISQIKKYSRKDWQVLLKSNNISIVILCDQGEISVFLSPTNSDMNFRIGLLAMVYYLSSGNIFIGRHKPDLFHYREKVFEEQASLLKKYYDQIAPYLGIDYAKFEHEIKVSGQKYLKLFEENY